MSGPLYVILLPREHCRANTATGLEICRPTETKAIMRSEEKPSRNENERFFLVEMQMPTPPPESFSYNNNIYESILLVLCYLLSKIIMLEWDMRRNPQHEYKI